MDDSQERFAIRLRGLPWSATDAEIIEFIDCSVVNGENGIKRTYTREGRPSGEAYVELYSQDDVIKCLDKDRAKMGKRYIEIFQSSAKEMDYVLSRNGDDYSDTKPGQGGSDCIVRLRGLPYQCSKEEVAQFFSGLEIMPNGISLPLDDSGRSTGEAFVEFATSKGVEGALRKHKEKIGHRYIEIFKSNRRELNAAFGEYDRSYMGRGRPGPYDRPRARGMRGGRYMGRGGGGGYGGFSRGGGSSGYGGYGDYYDNFDDDDDYSWNEGGFGNGNGRFRSRGSMKGFRGGRSFGGGSYGGGYDDDDDYYDDGGNMGSQTVVHLRGLPYKATDEDISNFFSPIVPVRIHREYGRDGRTSGEANVEFASLQDAQAAMQKDGESMMHRYIELFLRGSAQKGGRGRRRGMGGGSRGFRY